MRRRSLPIAALRGVLAVTLAALAPVPLGTAASLVAPGVAGAEPIADCTETTGVLVAVDFTSFGGAIEEACVADPASGEAALQEAGFSPVPVSSQSGFAVCQLTDPATGVAEPGTSCVSMPPASAYWSYWHGLPGQGNWTYSTSGAGSYQNLCQGSIEFWAFGSGGTPATSPAVVRGVAAITPVASPQCPSATPPPPAPPPAAPATTASPKTTPPAAATPSGPAPNSTAPSGPAQSGSAPPNPATSTAPAASPTGVGRSGPGVASSPNSATGTSSHGPPTTTSRAGASTTTRRGTATSPTTTTPRGSRGARATSASSTTAGPAKSGPQGGKVLTGGHPVRIADVPTFSTHRGNSGSPVGLLAGIGVLALLGGGAGIFAWRRHQRAQL